MTPDKRELDQPKEPVKTKFILTIHRFKTSGKFYDVLEFTVEVEHYYQVREKIVRCFGAKCLECSRIGGDMDYVVTGAKYEDGRDYEFFYPMLVRGNF